MKIRRRVSVSTQWSQLVGGPWRLDVRICNQEQQHNKEDMLLELLSVIISTILMKALGIRSTR